MLRKFGVVAALAFAFLFVRTTTISGQAFPNSAAAPDNTATPDNAATFLGDWTLAAEGPNGPVSFSLSIKVDSGKVVADISSDAAGTNHITAITKSDKSLVLSYEFDAQGSPVPVVLTLTPNGDKYSMTMDFANGAFDMSGTATKAKSS